MTDLEDLWDDLRVSPAPMDSILRRARASARPPRRLMGTPEHRLRRSLVAIGAVGALAASFVAGAVVVGGGGSSGVDGGLGSAADIAPAAFHGALNAPASCDDLLAHYVDQAVKLVGPDGWVLGSLDQRRDYAAYDSPAVRSPNNLGRGLTLGSLNGVVANTDSVKGSLAPQTTRQTSSDTGTNVQEAGVDEPDIVKTDGTLLVRLHDTTLTTFDVSGPKVVALGDLDVGDLTDGVLLLSGTTVVVLSTTPTSTRVETVDVSDPATPVLRSTVDYDAPLAAARQHGTDVRLVLQSTLPKLDFVHPGVDVSVDDAKAANVKVVRDSAVEDWLPRVRSGSSVRTLLSCRDVAIPRADLGLGTMSIVGFAADDATKPQAIGLAGVAPTTYESTDRLYLAASPVDGSRLLRCFDCVADYGYQAGTGTTDLYEFKLDGAGASYLAAGEVDGTVNDRWSLDEVDGVLRVAVEASHQTGNFTSIVTFHRQGDQLLELGRLDGLGRGEQMESVRWFDGLALLVTYRQVDPLYAVDLSAPARPTLLGKLRLAGFTSYLYPLGTERVIGLGEGPVPGRGGSRGFGARAGLFDTSDPTSVKRIDLVDYQSGSTPRAAVEPRQFTWLPHDRTAVTVVQRGNTGYVSTLHLADGTIDEHRIAAEYGDDVALLRMVPVPGAGSGPGSQAERVVLVTGGTVSFLDLGGR